MPLDAAAPTSTYRLQLHKGFTFDDARGLLDYFDRLGVGSLYFSPYLQARPDSTHGYDVSDHNAISRALGGERAHSRLSRELRRRGLGHIVDLVPNHMGIGEPSNTWWMDVLENGPSSIYADYFDVDWDPLKPELRNRVLLPVLGDQYGVVLERGELSLRFQDGAFFLTYYERQLPLSPRSYNRVLEPALARLRARVEVEKPDDAVVELQSIATAVRHLPTSHERGPAARRERHREKEVVKRRLAAVVAADRGVARAIKAVVTRLNGRPGDPASFDRLDDLIGIQCYHLAFWRVASEEINYRRFFDVNELAGIRMEHPEVFAATHRLILDLVASGTVTGLRIDHPDGLWDPAAYLARLQEAANCPIHVVVEKILAAGELLPSDWQVGGTVGYEYLNALNGLFVDPAGERPLDRLYERFVGEPIDFANLVRSSKMLIIQTALASEVNVLANQLSRLSERDRRHRDFTLYALRHAVREVIASFPVYRTYVSEQTAEPSASDRAHVERASAEAKRRNPADDPTVFDFLANLLLLRVDDPKARHFVMKFQQTTGPIAAKGVEDTAFYVYNRLVSLNEVGGEPDRFGGSVAAFHALNAHRQSFWPGGLSTTSTHDTKRSEDVRARINVFSELPREWARAVSDWSRRARRHTRRVDGRRAPDRNEEYLLWQTIVGAWPIERQRLVAYMQKATKEAKVNTSWINPNPRWDEAVAAFAEAVLTDLELMAAVEPFARRVAHYGAYNSLSQTLLKLASPGVPDIFQGQELWDFSLVDPDNRRPVDYSHRRAVLTSLLASRPDPADLLANWHDGRLKLWLTHRALCLRRARPALFSAGTYLPIESGPHAVAFARQLANDCAIAIAPRLIASLAPDPARPPIGALWGDTVLQDVPPGRYRDVLTDAILDLQARARLETILTQLPIALLVRL